VRNKRRIAVFGRADLQPGTPDYRDAVELGRLIAAEGWTVVTGGYGGAMEAVSRGAFEAGGETEGVLCSAFEGRRPNGYLSRQVWTADLWQRTRLLLEGADAYAALAPRAGTLAEVANLWSLWKSGFLSPRPLVLAGAAWGPIMAGLEGAGALEENLLEWTVRAEGTGSALSVLRDALGEGLLDGQIQR
jgi:uncharacterized protein (TIGR00725 family)